MPQDKNSNPNFAMTLAVQWGNNPEEVARRIAIGILGLETLETRGRDSLDFHDMSVRVIEQALVTAFRAGQASMTLVRDKSNDIQTF